VRPNKRLLRDSHRGGRFYRFPKTFETSAIFVRAWRHELKVAGKTTSSRHEFNAWHGEKELTDAMQQYIGNGSST
jgi:hypothetical protein